MSLYLTLFREEPKNERPGSPPPALRLEGMIHVLFILGGGLLLYVGAEGLVSGASGLARRLGVPPLLVGLTVVAYGTSAPEAIVTLQGSLADHGALAVGNILGSNLANLGLILGLALTLRPAPHEPGLTARDVPVLVLSTLTLGLILADGYLARWEGLGLLLGGGLYSAWMVRDGLRQAATSDPEPSAAHAPSLLQLGLRILLGIVGLVLGGHGLVEGSVGLARLLGLSERIIGLTLVAVGTSLPELATSALAAWRGASAIAVGNVVGSNIFNALFALGLAGSVAPLRLPEGPPWVDLGAMTALTLIAIQGFLRPKPLSRTLGLAFLGSYGLFLLWTFGVR